MKFFNKLFGNKQDLQCQNESGIDSARLHRDDIVTNEKKEEVKYNKLNNILKEYIKWSKEPCIEDEALDILKIFGNDEFQALYVYVKENSNNDNVLHTLKVLGMSLNEMDISKACATAHYCGMLIEHSNILDISDNLVDLFEKLLT